MSTRRGFAKAMAKHRAEEKRTRAILAGIQKMDGHIGIGSGSANPVIRAASKKK